MKSTKYSVKSAFGAAFKSVFRRQFPGAAVIAAICACLSVISAIIYCMNNGSPGYNDISGEVLIWGSFVLFAVSVYCAVSVGIMYNSYFSRRACDYHFAMPYKRSNIYNSNFLFGLLAIVFALIVSAASFALTVKIIETVYNNSHFTTINFTVQYAVILKPLLTLLAALLAGYSVCSMCAAAAGKWLQYAAFCFIGIISVPVMLIGIASRISDVWGFMADVFRFSSVTPVGVAAMIARGATDKMYVFMSVVSLAEFAAMYLAGLLTFKHRKAEIAENGQGGTLIKYILMIVFVISGFVYFSAEKNFLATAVTGVITAFACAALFSAGQVRRKKIFTKQTGIIFGVVTGVCLILTASVYLINSSSYVKYVPKADEVQSVTVAEYDSFSGYTNEPLWYIIELLNGEPTSSGEVTLDEPQNIQAVIDFHNRAVSDEVMNYTLKNKISETIINFSEATTVSTSNANDADGAVPTEEEITEAISCTIEYKLKNGGTVKRSYTINYDLWHEFLAAFKTQEAIMQQEPYSINTDEILYVEGTIYNYDQGSDDSYFTSYNTYIISPQEWADIRDVLVEDRINESDYDFRYGFDGAGYFTIYTLAADLPQEQKDLILSMTPRERYDFVAEYNTLLTADPEKYSVYPVEEASVNINNSDKKTVQLMQSPEMQNNLT